MTSASSAREPAVAWLPTPSPRPAPRSSCSKPAANGSPPRTRRCSPPRGPLRAVAPPSAPAPSASSTPATAAGTSKASRSPAPRHPVRLVARPHARRAHEPLGAHLPPLRPRRLQGQVQGRTRRGLADLLRRRQAVVRQDRRPDRRLRQQRRPPQSSRWQLPAGATPALL